MLGSVLCRSTEPTSVQGECMKACADMTVCALSVQGSDLGLCVSEKVPVAVQSVHSHTATYRVASAGRNFEFPLTQGVALLQLVHRRLCLHLPPLEDIGTYIQRGSGASVRARSTASWQLGSSTAWQLCGLVVSLAWQVVWWQSQLCR